MTRSTLGCWVAAEFRALAREQVAPPAASLRASTSSSHVPHASLVTSRTAEPHRSLTGDQSVLSKETFGAQERVVMTPSKGLATMIAEELRFSETKNSACRGGDAFEFFLLAHGIGSHITITGLVEFVDDAAL